MGWFGLRIMADINSILDIQRNIASRLESDSKMDQSIKLLGVIQSLVTDSTGRVSKEEVYHEAKQQGFLRAEAEVLLRELIRHKSVAEDDGYVVLF